MGGSHRIKIRKGREDLRAGGAADAVFYIQKGKAKITVVSAQGKEAVVAVLGAGDFCGEGCLAGQPRRMATASAMTDCDITRLEKAFIIRLLQDQPQFSEMFVAYFWPGPSASRRIWSISRSIPAKNAWREFFC